MKCNFAEFFRCRDESKNISLIIHMVSVANGRQPLWHDACYFQENIFLMLAENTWKFNATCLYYKNYKMLEDEE